MKIAPHSKTLNPETVLWAKMNENIGGPHTHTQSSRTCVFTCMYAMAIINNGYVFGVRA